MFKKLLIATAILATTSSIAMANSSAPYLGASLGVNTTTASNGVSYRGVPITIFGGYGAILNQSIYLGGELFGTVGTITLNNNNSVTTSVKTSYGYGASFIPGYVLADRTMLFARLGLVRTDFSSIGSYSTGAQLGMGLQTNLMQNWDIRGEYDYTGYNRISGVTPKSDLFNLGFIYKID
jgi:opacity protein-like surface antigen